MSDNEEAPEIEIEEPRARAKNKTQTNKGHDPRSIR